MLIKFILSLEALAITENSLELRRNNLSIDTFIQGADFHWNEAQEQSFN